ncbi:ABC transporter permease [Hamadaea tsunoensis]|uniref:ABC transporter permease n=1 Tax=Hamadaea tsunoensis TaxID=53368 RepID=UPI000480D52D|nr:FtsX-like permease family protein [Hamadaea tsunoensis]
MIRTTLAGLRTHLRRLLATAIAVVLGVGFVAGTLIFTATARAGFFDTFARTAKNVDVSVLAGGQRLPLADLDRVRALAGVAAADGRLADSLALLDREGKPVTNFSRAGYAVSTDGDPLLRPFDVVGRVPAGDGEALLDKETAGHQHLVVGDTITVLDRAGARHPLTLVGLLDFGVSKTYSGWSVVGLPAARIAALTGATGYDEIVVRAAAGTDPGKLAGSVRPAVAKGAKVSTGDKRREQLANDATSVATQFSIILLVFGAVSLVVAVFVIYNTFAILLAQRVRETALLRCVGATRGQVFGATVLESAVVGLGGGFLGVLAGVGIAYGLFALLNGVLNAGVPAHSIVLGPAPVLAGLTLGVVVTVLAALLPAVRATRTAPLAALRDLAPLTETGRVRRIVRLAVAVLFVAAGAAVTVAGHDSADSQAGTFLVVAGGIVAFLGLLVAAPLFVGRLTAAVGVPVRWIAGTPARVAVANARRNPGRTAATTATLMIAIGLMCLCAVVLASIKATARDQLSGHYPVDYAVTGLSYEDGKRADLPPEFARSLRARPEFAGVAEVRVLDVRIDGRPARIGAVDAAALGGLITLDMTTGDAGALGTGTVIIPPGTPQPSITVTAGGRATSLRVVGTAKTTIPGSGQLAALVSWDQLTALGAGPADAVVMAKAASGVAPTASRDAIDAVARPFPLAQVNSVADLSSDLDKAVNGLIGLFAGLLGTAVVIALFGVANTLSLSVVERTRESATLRAVGLTRAQLRGTLLVEAVLMGLVGAVVGIAYGMIYGPLVVATAFRAIDPRVVVPWAWLAGLMALAALASCLAAVLPARKAASASIVAALADV